MSDSVKKYFEENSSEPLMSSEEKRENDILEQIAKAVKAGKIATVSERAKQVQEEYNGASLLVGLQIACDEQGIE